MRIGALVRLVFLVRLEVLDYLDALVRLCALVRLGALVRQVTLEERGAIVGPDGPGVDTFVPFRLQSYDFFLKRPRKMWGILSRR